MTFAQPTVSPLRQRMIDNMRMRRLSPKTQASYLRIVREFARYRHRRGPANLPAASGRSWHVAGVTERRDYRLEVLLRDHAPRSRADDPDAARALRRTLPVVLSSDEVRRLIAATGNLKHQAALSVAYGTGLRASEVVALKVGHIDSQRMTLLIEQGKGRKDR
jgi:integrase/recombinase XerD